VLQKQHEGKTMGTVEFHARDMESPHPAPIHKPGGDTVGDENSVPARAVDLIKGLAVVRQSRP
jgi:hypothetical protein